MRKPKTIVIFNNHYEIKSGQDGYGLDAILMYYRQENDGSGTMNCFIIELPTSCQLLRQENVGLYIYITNWQGK